MSVGYSLSGLGTARDNVSGDWKYTLVRPDGLVFGETKGPGAARVEYCVTCHLAQERYDHLYFIPKEYRR